MSRKHYKLLKDFNKDFKSMLNHQILHNSVKSITKNCNFDKTVNKITVKHDLTFIFFLINQNTLTTRVRDKQ